MRDAATRAKAETMRRDRLGGAMEEPATCILFLGHTKRRRKKQPHVSKQGRSGVLKRNPGERHE